MSEQELCAIHEWPRYQCPPECSASRRGPSQWVASVEPDYDGPRPGPESILISSTGFAHRLGCQHLPEYAWLVPPKWGWTESADLWSRIGVHPVHATQGNTHRVAERRCLDCDEIF